MDVADRIVVMDQGRIQQEGSPRELYEQPANEFVMSFIGPVTRLDDAFIRPHDLEVIAPPLEGVASAIVDRVVYLGFEVRVELVSEDGSRLWVQVPREEADRLDLIRGQRVSIRPRRAAVPVTA